MLIHTIAVCQATNDTGATPTPTPIYMLIYLRDDAVVFILLCL